MVQCLAASRFDPANLSSAYQSSHQMAAGIGSSSPHPPYTEFGGLTIMLLSIAQVDKYKKFDLFNSVAR